ncbi:MAG: hypothetical protein M1828_000368 [Chrysothrix sp. TS-e1954]|nr:MAG: hypothetical protein M1828_000368 [Chrysothrix sp. TS-e1954]
MASLLVLKTSIYHDIRQIIISPYGDYLAILTSHTVHVGLLPDSSHLSSSNAYPLRLKTFQVGPTTHVLDQSAVITALWHPCGVNGTCLVTVTVDAVIRLWQLEKKDPWSFNDPKLALDLKRMAHSTSAVEDYSPTKFGSNTGYSPDSFQMEIAGACFGSYDQEAGNPWAPMTLWIAMREGDIYALSPILPDYFELDSQYLPRLASWTSFYQRDFTTDRDVAIQTHLTDTQVVWISDVISQAQKHDQRTTQHLDGHTSVVFRRPTIPRPIPQLQGPLRTTPDTDDVFDVTDIQVIPAGNVNTFDDKVSHVDINHSTSPLLEIICVTTGDGYVRSYLLSDELQAQWLPVRMDSQKQSPSSGGRRLLDLLTLESIKLFLPTDNCWPLFTDDERTPGSLFVTHAQGVAWIDFTPWIQKLSQEAAATETEGDELRMEILAASNQVAHRNPVSFPRAQMPPGLSTGGCSACISIVDSDLGNLVLAISDSNVEAATLEPLDVDALSQGEASEGIWHEHHPNTQELEPRPPYQPPQEIWSESVLTSFMDQHLSRLDRHARYGEIQLSSRSLDLGMEAHRILSHETHLLGSAAADLFRRCERLQDEFGEQVRRVEQAASRIDSVVEEEPGEAEELEVDDLGSNSVENRLHQANSREDELLQRYSGLRKKVASLCLRPINEKESAWMAEIDSFETLLDRNAKHGVNDAKGTDEMALNMISRYDQLQNLRSELLQSAEKERLHGAKADADSASALSPLKRKARWADIGSMLEREGALIILTTAKLAKLQTVCT